MCFKQPKGQPKAADDAPRVTNVIATCDQGLHRYRLRHRRDIQGIAIHRFGLELADSACGILAFYRANPEWTGGQMPYTLVFHQDGRIEQALKLSEVGPHARRWSAPMIGCAFLGDFRKHPPTRAQWTAAVDVFANISAWLGLVNIKRHDQLPGGSSDPNKKCPGEFFNVEDLALEVSESTKLLGEANLIDAGIEI